MGQLDYKYNLNLDEYEDLSYKIRKYGDQELDLFN